MSVRASQKPQQRPREPQVLRTHLCPCRCLPARLWHLLAVSTFSDLTWNRGKHCWCSVLSISCRVSREVCPVMLCAVFLVYCIHYCNSPYVQCGCSSVHHSGCTGSLYRGQSREPPSIIIHIVLAVWFEPSRRRSWWSQ